MTTNLMPNPTPTKKENIEIIVIVIILLALLVGPSIYTLLHKKCKTNQVWIEGEHYESKSYAIKRPMAFDEYGFSSPEEARTYAGNRLVYEESENYYSKGYCKLIKSND